MTEYDYLVQQIEEKVDVLGDALVGNQAGSIEEYRWMAGQVYGLIVAMNIIKTRAVQKEEDDDE